jgi:hypothetical protein
MSQDLNDSIYPAIVEKLLPLIKGDSTKDKCLYLSKILNVSDKAVYNKLTMRSALTVDELYQIARHERFSLDSLIPEQYGDRSYIPFYSDGVKYSPRHYHEYLSNINYYFNKIKSFSNTHGYFLANEIPLFHLLDHTYLMYLKLYIWNKINWDIPNHGTEFMPEILDALPEFKQECRNLKDAFRCFESTEVWNPGMLNNTIEQWKYLKDIGVIKDPQMDKTFKNELNKLIHELETMTDSGYKIANHKSQSYKSNIFITGLNMGSELIIVRSDNASILFQQLDVPNYLRTTDTKMIQKAWEYFNRIKKTANHISDGGDKEKIQFFNTLKQKVEQY